MSFASDYWTVSCMACNMHKGLCFDDSLLDVHSLFLFLQRKYLRVVFQDV